jgi:hypothetical protein
VPRSKITVIIVSLVLLLILASAFWVFSTRSRASAVTLRFAGYNTNSSGERVVSFTFTNGSPYRVVSPDSCGIQFQEQPRPAMVDLRDISLTPNSAESFTIVPPTGQGIWRAGLSHYSEDRVNQLKARYGSKPWVRGVIPMRMLGVRGYWAWSEWFTNDAKIGPTNVLHSAGLQSK